MGTAAHMDRSFREDPLRFSPITDAPSAYLLGGPKAILVAGRFLNARSVPEPRMPAEVRRTAHRIDALMRTQLDGDVSARTIAKRFVVDGRRVRGARDGVPICHEAGPRPRIVQEIRSFIETNFLDDAQISDETMPPGQ
jgi:hypothetical protein